MYAKAFFRNFWGNFWPFFGPFFGPFFANFFAKFLAPIKMGFFFSEVTEKFINNFNRNFQFCYPLFWLLHRHLAGFKTVADPLFEVRFS